MPSMAPSTLTPSTFYLPSTGEDPSGVLVGSPPANFSPCLSGATQALAGVPSIAQKGWTNLSLVFAISPAAFDFIMIKNVIIKMVTKNLILNINGHPRRSYDFH